MSLSDGAEQTRKFDRVVILRIIPFSPERKIQDERAVKTMFRASGQIPTTNAEPLESSNISSLPRTGWLNEFVGPVEALIAQRGTSQNERNSLILDLFAKQFLRPDESHEPGSKVYYLQLVFDPVDQSVSPPLSWKLNRRQVHQIDAAWDHLEHLPTDNNSPLHVLDGYFQTVPGAKTLGPISQRQIKP